MVFRELKGLRHVVGHFLPVASEHDGLLHTKRLELGDSLSTVGLDLIVDDDMTRILPIDGYVNVLSNYITLLSQVVEQGYLSAEEANTTLASYFK